MRNIILSISLYLICALMISLYSVLLYFIGHNFWPNKAKGSLIIDNESQIRGSALLAQKMVGQKYFHPRTTEKFDSNCDVALYNDKLKTSLIERYKKAEYTQDISSITASSSLLDPYIMKKDAIKQAARIAKNRNIDVHILLNIIEEHSLNKEPPFFDLEIVNTTILNSILIMNIKPYSSYINNKK